MAEGEPGGNSTLDRQQPTHVRYIVSARDAERKYLQVLVANLARCIVSARDAERKYLSRVARSMAVRFYGQRRSAARQTMKGCRARSPPKPTPAHSAAVILNLASASASVWASAAAARAFAPWSVMALHSRSSTSTRLVPWGIPAARRERNSSFAPGQHSTLLS